MFQKLYKWIDESLRSDMPEAIKVFFNLVENSGFYLVELIGASSFDENNSDWACSEIFKAPVSSIKIPPEVAGGHWEHCLESMQVIIQNYLNSSVPGALKLNSVQGVFIGFVGGELHIFKQP